MSLCQFLPLWFFACTIIGGLVGRFVFHDTLAGAWLGGGIGILPLLLLWVVGIWLTLVVREHPKCRCGRWKSEDYDYIGPDDHPPVEFDYRCRCCRRRYRHREDICYEVDRDGTEVPYMRQNRWSRWRPVAEG